MADHAPQDDTMSLQTDEDLLAAMVDAYGIGRVLAVLAKIQLAKERQAAAAENGSAGG